jgi:tetratricopeptide (TPR) repeat protein
MVTSMKIARVVVVLALAARVAAADTSEAEQLFQQGQAAYDGKRYADAIAAWDRAYQLSKLPAMLFNIAQAHRLAGHCALAVENYRKFVQLDPAAEDKPAAEQFIRELGTCGATTTPATPVTVPHTEDRGRGKRIAGISSGTAGVLMLVAGGYFGNVASGNAADIRTACASGCEWTDIESKDAAGRRAEKLQYVFLGAGAAAVATGVWLYLRGARARDVLVEPQPGGATVKVLGRF